MSKVYFLFVVFFHVEGRFMFVLPLLIGFTSAEHTQSLNFSVNTMTYRAYNKN